MGNKTKSNKLRLIFGSVYLIISIYILTLNFYYPKFSSKISYVVNNSIFYTFSFFSNIPNLYKNYISNIKYIKELEQKNLDLEQKLHSLNSVYIKNSVLSEENLELKKLLKVTKDSTFNLNKIITTTIYSKNLSSNSAVFILSAGSNNGIGNNLTVVANNALVGRTIDTNKDYTKVILLTNDKSRVPVYTKQSNINAIIVGNNSSTPSLISYDKNQNLKEGEVILTSGLGGIFPRNIPVGTIYKDKNTWFVKLFNDFSNIHYVHIITTKYKIKN